MRKFQLLVLAAGLLLSSIPASSQQDEEQAEVSSNPIIFMDMHLGHAVGRSGGLAFGATLNYQNNSSLFTFRITANSRFTIVPLSPFLPLPFVQPKSNLDEYALMYGIRKIQGSYSYSLSLGVSYNEFTEHHADNNNQLYKVNSNYYGMPFEASFKFFKNEKSRYRLFYLFPVGQPTAFGKSIGVKIFGNISKVSYGGIGLSYGLGLHKKY